MSLDAANRKLLVATDGYLLDRVSYSYEPARPALRLFADREIALVLGSSKTRAEMTAFGRTLSPGSPLKNG